jgi:hypothetical protein
VSEANNCGEWISIFKQFHLFLSRSLDKINTVIISKPVHYLILLWHFSYDTHNWIGHSLFDALRQNRAPKVIFGRSSFFALLAQKR